MTPRFNFWLVTLLLLVGIPYWWLLLDNRHDGIAPQPLHISQLRQLAGAMPGPRARAIEFEIVARRSAMGTVMAAGIGVKWRNMGVSVYRLPVTGRAPIVLNSGMTASQASALAFSNYDPAAQARVNHALATAGVILATNETAEHLGGLSAIAMRPGGAAVMAHALLRPQQVLRDPKQGLDWPARLPLAPADTRPHAVAPGVVVIPAPSHSPGSQLVFVTLADGRELLFASDVSALDANWEQLRARSRLLGEWHNREDRRMVYSWLLTIRQLKHEAPALIVVPGHDADWNAAMARNGTFRHGFTG